MTSLRLRASDCPIKSVTVYRSAAKIIRSLAVDIKAGRNTIDVVELSSSIEKGSLRVSSLKSPCYLLDVQYDVVPVAFTSQVTTGGTESRRTMLARKRELADEKKVQEQGLSLFVDYARTLNSSHTAPSDAVNVLDAFMAGQRSTIATIRKLEDQIAEIDTMLGEEFQQVNKTKGETDGRIIIDVVAFGDCSLDLDFTYNVKDVGLIPYYDFHATTADGRPATTVSLNCNALVTQTTGEDWNAVPLMFALESTPSNGRDSDIPSLAPLHISCVSTASQPASKPFGYLGTQAASAPAPSVSPTSLLRFGSRALGGGAAPGSAPSQSSLGSTAGRPGYLVFGSADGLFGRSANGQSTSMPFDRSAGDQASAAFQAVSGAFGSQTTNMPGIGGKSAFEAQPAAAPTTGVQTTTSLFGWSSAASAPRQAADTSSVGLSTEIDRSSGRVPTLYVSALGKKLVIRESGSPQPTQLPVGEKVSIPSDGAAHAVPIVMLTLDASFTWVCVPRSRADAFIECRTTNTSTYTLVAGAMSVYVDGKMVAKTLLKDVNPQRAFTTSLGIDDAVYVVHKRGATTEEDPVRSFSERTWTTRCTTRYTVKNKHAFAIPRFVLRDALPVQVQPQLGLVVKAIREIDPDTNENATITPDNQGGAILGEHVHELEKMGQGIFEWARGIEAGRMVALQAEWEVLTLAGASWKESPVN